MIAILAQDEGINLMHILYRDPWLIVVALGILIPLTSIIFGSITGYLRRSRQAELDASLKHEMLQRGMSAEEIKTVLESSSGGVRKGRRGSTDA